MSDTENVHALDGSEKQCYKRLQKNGFPIRFRFGGHHPSDSKLVTEARYGDLESVKQIIGSCSEKQKVGTVNAAGCWKEFYDEDYEKGCEWFGDTALIAAAREGNVEVVKFLLLAEADPTLCSCPEENVYETAGEAALKRKKNLDMSLENTQIGNHYVWSEPKLYIRDQLEKINSYKIIMALIKKAIKHWKRAEYSRPHFDESNRASAFVENPNKTTNVDDLKKAVNAVVVECEIDQDRFDELSKRYIPIVEMKREEIRQSKRDEVTEMRDRIRKYLNDVPERINCQGSGCDRLPARACVHGCCIYCCSGNCPRHLEAPIYDWQSDPDHPYHAMNARNDDPNAVFFSGFGCKNGRMFFY